MTSRGRGTRRDDRVFGGAHAPRFSLHRHRRRRRGGRRGSPGAADLADEPGRLDHRGRRAGRDRSRADRRGPDRQGVLALQADLHLPPHARKRSTRPRTSTSTSLPDPEPDSERVKAGHEQWLVVIGICTHLGCIPLAHQGEYDGWFCPCHGSQYDSAGPHPQRPGAEESRCCRPTNSSPTARSGSADPQRLESRSKVRS